MSEDPKTKDCFTCKWEPEWEERCGRTIGKCKIAAAFSHSIFSENGIFFQYEYDGQGAADISGKKYIEDCILWESK